MDITINAETNLSLEDLKSVKASIEFIIDELARDLNIKYLAEIIFTNKFKEDIFSLQRKYGLQEEVTDDETAICAGKTIYNAKNKSCVIIFRITIINDVFERGPRTQQMINLINHELGHVHDYTMNWKIRNAVNELVDNIYIPSGLILWEEYIATRLASKTMGKDFNFGFTEIVYYYEATNLLVNKAICNYQLNRNMISLFKNIYLDISRFIISCCYSFGYLDGHILDDLTKMNLLESNLRNIFQLCYIKSLHTELVKLHEKYPHWESADELHYLSKAYFDCWNIFGIKVDYDGKGLVLNII